MVLVRRIPINPSKNPVTQVQINLESASSSSPKMAATIQQIIPDITNAIMVRFVLLAMV